MQTTSLQLRRALSAALFVLLLSVVGTKTAFAQISTHYALQNTISTTEDAFKDENALVRDFTPYLDIPQNLTAVDTTVFNDENIILNWDSVTSSTFRKYFIYRNGVKIGETAINNINATTFNNGILGYNMSGYVYYVTAVYDEGESAPSNTITVKVSGRGSVNGHVYKQDGTTRIAGATVTMIGQDEFGISHTYNFATNAQGYYSGAVYAGEYNGSASCDGYQTINAPAQGNPIGITYNQTTSQIDYILSNPICTVIVEYYPDSLDSESPFVKVYWGVDLIEEGMVELFETGDFSLFDWHLSTSYPWEVTTTHPYEGTYCMRSTNYNVASSTSSIDVTVDIPADGIMSFFGYISSENNWDYGYFYIDNVQKGAYTGAGNSWVEKEFWITEGTHNFKWAYTKDGSGNSNEDRFYVDYITFHQQPEPAQPGWHTYCESEFNNAYGSNQTTTPSWAYEYPASFLHANYAGWNITKVSLFSDNMYSAVGGNYTCRIYVGGTQPGAGTMVSELTVDVPQNQNAWVDWDLTTPVSVTGNDPIWVVWTANSTVSNWPAGLCGDQNNYGNWWDGGNGWGHQTNGTWTMRQYFADNNGRGSYYNNNQVEIQFGQVGSSIEDYTGIGNISYYKVYRTNCDNNGPYTNENISLLADGVSESPYIDQMWETIASGSYKYGVRVVFEDGTESDISWSNCIEKGIKEISAIPNPAEGGTVAGAGSFVEGETCVLTAMPNEGYSFCFWTENDTIVFYSPTYTFTVLNDRNLVANFGDCPGAIIGDGGTATSQYLPSYSFYRYTLSQQIYTAGEIGKSGDIVSVAFYNGRETITRDYDIYLVSTDKTSFESATDWVAATADDLVFSGSVTMEAGMWTVINLDTPFSYDVSSNLALIVDDNSGYYTGSMACRVFETIGNQAIRIYSDGTNYDPFNPTQYNGVRLAVKNQIILGFNSAIETSISDEICQGEDYLQNGFEIYYPEVGENEYSITLPSSQGLDSIVNLMLTVYPIYYYMEDTTLCNTSSFTWRGHTYTESGVYYDSLQTIHGCDSIYALSLEFFNTPLGEFASMTPTNNYPFTSLPITFSWDAVSGAEYYNFYLWNVNDPVPSTPFTGNIYNRSCYVSSLQNHQTYNWYVEAVNTCSSTTSSVRSFSLNIPSTMSVSSSNLDFGEVALDNSNTLNLYVSGNALDDTITVQMTGEDASMFSFEQGSNWNGLTGGSLLVTFSPTTVKYNYTANLVITTGTLTQTVQLTGSLADMFVFNTYVTQDVFEMNGIVPIYGTVMDANNNPASSAEVEVKVTVMNMTRSLFATTGADGHFSVDFVPAYSESGYYAINSGRVGHNSTAVHDDFNIPGMNLVTNDWILWDVVQNETSTGSIVIRNRSQIPLNNIQVTANTLPGGCSFTFQPLSLAGMEEGVLEYSVSGTTPTNGYQEVNLVATSSEGASMNFTVWYRCTEPRGILYAAPNNVTTTMTQGINKIVDVMLYNNGNGPTGSVYLDLPSVDWLSVVGNDTLPSIAVHDSAYFSLRLSANENTPLVQYTGNIAINCERGDGLLLPYTIMAVSDSTGTLIVDVTDDYTYNGNGQHLAGATVTMKGYYSLQTVAIGLTDSDGLFTVSDIPEGYYRMSITAPHHAEYQATIQIEGGQTNTQNIYLQYQAITYSWVVVPTEIQDEYTFELIVEYETNVPVPVVVIDMPHDFPELEPGESYVFDYVISNQGLVDAYEATLYPPTDHPLYDFTPLITEIDTLHAQSSVVIPCTMTVRTGQRSSMVYAALNGRGDRDDDECPDRVKTKVVSYYYCRGEKIYVEGYQWVQIGSHPCHTSPSSGGGGMGQGGSGGPGFPYVALGGSRPIIYQQQEQGCSEDPNLPGALQGAMGGLGGCPPPSDGTPKLPPQPGNNRRKNN